MHTFHEAGILLVAEYPYDDFIVLHKKILIWAIHCQNACSSFTRPHKESRDHDVA